ncbi:phospholipase D-like domain-containing protein [Spirosoma sp. RP8]|uniref:Phospholipase D-like domain-containing protein n=1 Tax=Spirosoma liriopis TaxID=2937440 RepID=A0ABT0HHY5_9BACT|nr:phospholipase D-like domain-containing protein [Spirosoma liriopis]MCK8491771.1 phospholipase D-like domain-containing protein [Spirosoma liriopis]
MNKRILSQGITDNIEHSVGSFLLDNLISDQNHTFTAISAFASEAGINGLTESIEQAKQQGKTINIIVGVDQKSTSKEALEAILNLDINSYIFFQKNFSIFHPKIYLFEGNHTSQLVIGSSNLTRQGLFMNVEASLCLELSHENDADLEILSQLKERYSGLFNFDDPNLQPITSELIGYFVAENIVPTEIERKAIEEKLKGLESPPSEVGESIISNIFPKRALATAPPGFSNKKPKKVTLAKSTETVLSLFPEVEEDQLAESAEEEHFTLVWQMKNVPGSSVQVTKSAKTNPTGMLRLVQADFRVDGTIIDHTSYFRSDVFNTLLWVSETEKTEIAIGKFRVSILGNFIGEHPLRIRHKPSGESGQGNYTTGLSWGAIGKTIQENNLAGRTIKLYHLDGSEDTFKLEIE